MTAYHIPVLLKESVQGLAINPHGDYVDATFGGGSHSREILKGLKSGRLFAFDQDKDAAENIIKDDRFFFIMHNFRFLKNFLIYKKVDKVNGILADLGVSSHDFDVAERGFSFRFDSTLDMRMNQKAKMDAVTVINKYSAKDLERIFRNYGEIKNAGKLVSEITRSRSDKPIKSTQQFKQSIKSCIPGHFEHKFLAKVYQALRIEVNNEMEVLKEFLMSSLEMLDKGGRLVVITYHSLEDRIVKNFMKTGNFEGKQDKDFYGNIKTPFKLINNKVIVPDANELNKNPRSRSAKLRIAEKI